MVAGVPVAIRIVRGVTLAAACAALTLAAHAAGSSELPDTGLTITLTLLFAAMCVGLADRQRGNTAICLTAGTGQLVMHMLLTGLHGHRHAGADTGLAVGAAHPVAMACGHLLAAVIVSVLLCGAERAVFRLIGAALTALCRPPRPIIRDASPRGVNGDGAVGGAVRVALLRRHPRRGPPVLS